MFSDTYRYATYFLTYPHIPTDRVPDVGGVELLCHPHSLSMYVGWVGALIRGAGVNGQFACVCKLSRAGLGQESVLSSAAAAGRETALGRRRKYR
jgi:hypothetical protein